MDATAVDVGAAYFGPGGPHTSIAADGETRHVALPAGEYDLAALVALDAPTVITGAGAGNTTLRGSCGAGGLLAAAGAVYLSNLTLAGVALGACGRCCGDARASFACVLGRGRGRGRMRRVHRDPGGRRDAQPI